MFGIDFKSVWFGALGLAVALCGIPSPSAIAQSRLLTDRPSDPLPSDEFSTRREYPISRGVLPAPNPPNTAIGPLGGSMRHSVAGGLDIATSESSTGRDSEFELIQREADALERQLSLVRRIVKFASPSIVHIEASKKAGSGRGFASSRVDEAGAGVIVNLNDNQYVLTNRHVIHPADLGSIRIELNNGASLRPTQVWSDPSTDVAVMALPRRDLTAARLGDSDGMAIGDFVLAVGSPFGLSHSVTYGILSAKGRRNLELGSKEIDVQDFFQTDAAINPGNSGGPLLNLRGEVIAINTAIASNSGGNEGIGFSIPINMAMVVAEQLINKGAMRRSYLGVQLENAFDSITAARLGLSSTRGALVKAVLPNSPAERAGILVGDVILQFNGRAVENDGHLVRMVSLTPSGTKSELLIHRDGRPMVLPAVLSPSPE
jgi:serine protease Do